MRPASRLFDLMGKTAVVTGGARGHGLRIAEALGGMGAQIVLTGDRQVDLDAAVDHLGARGIVGSAVAAELASESGAAAFAAAAMTQLGHIDILVNDASATWFAPAEDFPLEACDRGMNLHARGVFLLSHAVGKLSMIPRRQGRIINIACNTSKAALMQVTRILAGEWERYGITVNAIAPDGEVDLKSAAAFLVSAAGDGITGRIIVV